MRLCKLLFFVLLIGVANSHESPYEETISYVTSEIENWVKEGVESEEFRHLLDSLALPPSLRRDDWRSFTGDRSTAICTICRSVLNTLMKFRRQGTPADEIRSKGIKICTRLNLASENVCIGVVTLNLPTILYIIDARPNLTSSGICGVLLESSSCPLNDDRYNWTINIDKGPRKSIHTDKTNETIRIVQITDIHYDPKYEPYGNSDCMEPACCRKGQNSTNVSGKLAGYWGDYNHCDSPWHAVVDVLDQIKTTHQGISYVYFTGDIVDHGVWETTLEGNKEMINKTYRQIYETFKNIRVYPTLGNHEPQPLDLYAPETITDDKISTQWLYDMIADMWINFGWLPESTRSTIRHGGYYTHSPKKGFRIIALNNNVCYCYNWWIWYEPRDPYDQLQWLASTLLQAEEDGEFVHILTHVPSHTECQATWKREYIKIVDRFAHIITAQFNGHTHNDELQLYYSIDDNTKVHNVAWNGGSTTAYTDLNPNYKLYIVDSKNYAVKNMENWMYNLTLANDNAAQRPLWYKSYSFKEEYDIPDLSYNSLNTWFSRLASDEALLDRYYRNLMKHAEPSLKKECDIKCKRVYMCRIIASLGDHGTYCR